MKTLEIDSRCLFNEFYIKPQLFFVAEPHRESCLFNEFYIKPQLLGCFIYQRLRCLFNEFYIKPQPWLKNALFVRVL